MRELEKWIPVNLSKEASENIDFDSTDPIMHDMETGSAFIDANALADLFVGEEGFRKSSEALRRRHPAWVTLSLCRHEFGNVIRRYTRLGKIGEADGMEMLRLGLAMVEYCADCVDEVVLAEANASNLTFYDAAYVARARSLGIWLYTRDAEILKNCPDVARSIESR